MAEEWGRNNDSSKAIDAVVLTDAKVTDEASKSLAGLTNLQILYLADTKVTDAGVAELRKVLPECDIVR